MFLTVKYVNAARFLLISPFNSTSSFIVNYEEQMHFEIIWNFFFWSDDLGVIKVCLDMCSCKTIYVCVFIKK